MLLKGIAYLQAESRSQPRGWAWDLKKQLSTCPDLEETEKRGILNLLPTVGDASKLRPRNSTEPRKPFSPNVVLSFQKAFPQPCRIASFVNCWIREEKRRPSYRNNFDA